MFALRILPAVLLIAAISAPADAAMGVRPYTPLYAALQELARARNVPFEQVLADPQCWLDEIGRRPRRAIPSGLSSTAEQSAEPLPIQFAQPLRLGTGFSRLATGDFDGDGIADLAAAGAAGTAAIFAGGAPHPLQSRRDVALESGDFLQAAADVDGDGKCDLIASGVADGTVAVYRSLGNSGFAAPARYPTGAGGPWYFPGGIAPGDLTGDGRPDLVILRDTLLVTLLNTGEGDFVAGRVTEVGRCRGLSVVLADFNGDSRQDVAFRSVCYFSPLPQTIRTLLSRGDGSFDPPVDTGDPGGYLSDALGAGDINGDGRADLIAFNSGIGQVRLLAGHGDGTFNEVLAVPLGGSLDWTYVRVADFNGDGRPDIAIRLQNGHCYFGGCPRVAVLLGSETEVLSQPHYYLTSDPNSPTRAGELVCADFDGDSSPDLAEITNPHAGGGADWLNALMNDGSGTFLAPLSLDLDFTPYGVATARLQANGPSDLLLWGGSSTLIARNRGIQGFARVTPFAEGEVVSTQDLDGDGTDDLILANSDSATVLLNDGAGGLRAPITYPGGFFLTCADFDAANGPDLAVADASRQVLIRPNNGHGEFGPLLDSGVLLKGDVTAVQGADLDLDGRADLLVGRDSGGPWGMWGAPSTTDTLAVHWNLGGSFARAESYGIALASYQMHSRPSTIATGNFDGDGQPDLLVVDAAWSDLQGGISILRGAGGRTLLPAEEFMTHPDPWAAVVADFDRDGLDDVAVVCDRDNFNGMIDVFQGTRGGVVGPCGIVTEHYPTSIALGDFDRDGRADLVVGTRFSRTAMILRNVSSPGAVTSTLVSLLSAQAERGAVHLTWYVPRGNAFSATIERSASGGAWTPLGQASADGSGHLTWTDRDVMPGARYGYRLGFFDNGHVVFAGQTWVEVPRAAVFALHGARPNPAMGSIALAFSLPDASPARLEVLDLAGRRILSRDVGAMGPGSHIVSVTEGRAVPVGVYYARLTGRGVSASARFALVR